MPETPEPIPNDDERSIADAEHLFRDDDRSKAPPAPRVPSAGFGESGYAMEEQEPPSGAGAAPTADTERELSPLPSAQARPGTARTGAATVDQVWSRGAEWGLNLAVLAIAALLVAYLVYRTLSNGEFSLAFLFLMGGAALLLVLSYPIIITMERPVRVTPEQAVKDYYAALSHHFPHYRRMWLLLSSAGRKSMSFSTYQGFKNYWKSRLAQLRGDRAGSLTPLVFQVNDFKSEKSAGLTTIDAKFSVAVFLRGKLNQGAIDSIRVNAGLVKGPDRMWYLNKGTLPGGGSLSSND